MVTTEDITAQALFAIDKGITLAQSEELHRLAQQEKWEEIASLLSEWAV